MGGKLEVFASPRTIGAPGVPIYVEVRLFVAFEQIVLCFRFWTNETLFSSW
jgi:hypothetical protein